MRYGASKVMIAALAALAPFTLNAQDKSSPDTIDVLGRKAEEVRREAEAFVRQTGVAERPVARWIDPVCPKVIGVSPQIAARIEARIRTVAETAGVRLARSRCDGNLLVAFSTNAGTVVKQIAARTPSQFESLSAPERDQLHGNTAPVRWWHTVQDRTKDGSRSQGNDVPPFVAGEGPGGVQLGGSVYLQYRPSALSTQMVRAITAATIVIDVKLAEGIRLDGVADLAALVGLAEIGVDEEVPANSILGLFTPNGPRALTALDANFLRALYKLPLDRTAIAHRGLLVRGLVNASGK